MGTYKDENANVGHSSHPKAKRFCSQRMSIVNPLTIKDIVDMIVEDDY